MHSHETVAKPEPAGWRSGGQSGPLTTMFLRSTYMRTWVLALIGVAGVAVVLLVGLAARPEKTDAQALARPAVRSLLTKVPIPERAGSAGISPSPNGRLIAASTRRVPAADPLEMRIYDMNGRTLASFTGPAVGGGWLSDSSGMAIVQAATDGSQRFDVKVLELDGGVTTVATGVRHSFDASEFGVGPGGRLLLRRSDEIVAVDRRSGGERIVARGAWLGDAVWDGGGNALFVDLTSAEVITADLDGRVLRRASLSPPPGVKIVEARVAGQSLDRRATMIGFRGDRTWDGGGQHGYGSRLVVDGIVRETFPAVRFDLATGPHEVFADFGARGALRYDLVTGASVPGGPAVTTGPLPQAISGGLLLAAPHVRPNPRVSIARIADSAWRELDLPFDAMTLSYSGRDGTFLIFDVAGAPWWLDGEMALAHSAAALPECRDTSPPSGPGATKPMPARTADEVRASVEWDPHFRHLVEDIAGNRQDANPLRHAAVPRCRVDLLQIGTPVFVARSANAGTWYVPIIFQGLTVSTARVSTIDGRGQYGGSSGGALPLVEEPRARELGSTRLDPVVRSRLVYATPSGKGPSDEIAWELTRQSGTIVYLFSSSPGAGPDGLLVEAHDVELVR